MAAERPFDDARFPDLEGFAECFLCGRWVDPLDQNRGVYEEPPAGPLLPIHLACAAPYVQGGVVGRARLSREYRRALNVMAIRQEQIAGFRR